MAGRYLDEEGLQKLDELLKANDAASPAPPEEQPELEEAAEVDEADEMNENTDAAGEMDAEAADEETVPDPNAGAEPQAPAPEAPTLPDGFQDVSQLIAAYNQMAGQMKQRGDDMKALRDMNQELVSIAEALGFGKDLNSVDLSVDDKLRSDDPKEAVRREMQQEFRRQLQPLVEQQQANLRGRMIDQAWKQFASEHEDLADLMDDVREVIKETPGLSNNEDGLGIAYHMARSKRYTPEKAMMEDEEFLARAAANPRIQERVIEEYLKKVNKGGEDAPVSVGGSGKTVPAAKKKAPTTVKEAHRLFERRVGR